MLVDMMKSLAEKEGLNLDYRNYDWAIKIQKIQKPIKAASPPLEEGAEEKPPREQDERPVDG